MDAWIQQHLPKNITTEEDGGTLAATEAPQSSPPCAREHSVTSGSEHLEIIKSQQRRLNVLIK